MSEECSQSSFPDAKFINSKCLASAHFAVASSLICTSVNV